LAYDYLGRTDLVHVLDQPGNRIADGEEGEWSEDSPTIGERTYEMSEVRVVAAAPKVEENGSAMSQGLDAVNVAAKNMQSDAPACNVCGHITVRSGTCYKCLNCGNSLGCS